MLYYNLLLDFKIQIQNVASHLSFMMDTKYHCDYLKKNTVCIASIVMYLYCIYNILELYVMIDIHINRIHKLN